MIGAASTSTQLAEVDDALFVDKIELRADWSSLDQASQTADM